ncbi:PadR family transcriptional regulator [Aquisphaera giovannonii]|uniref:PadR family transcriptional regulator n=1 Tax=Aquisphaera giovannonii TaxID=406548 RepID=UPI001AEF6C10|nr:PadR family transcriptional regulator [Aquisphaera giovannonii]
MRKGLVELAVLATISREETYGYRIVEHLRGREGLAFTESTIYPVLARLAREGALAVRVEPSRMGPPRRHYRLTSAGSRRLMAMEERWRVVSASISRLLGHDEHMKEKRDDDSGAGGGAGLGRPSGAD